MIQYENCIFYAQCTYTLHISDHTILNVIRREPKHVILHCMDLGVECGVTPNPNSKILHFPVRIPLDFIKQSMLSSSDNTLNYTRSMLFEFIFT